MTVTRRGFLGLMPALVAGWAVAKPTPYRVTINATLSPLDSLHPVTWSNIQTASPLTREALQRAILELETIPCPTLRWLP